jgi:hypothetical protein
MPFAHHGARILCGVTPQSTPESAGPDRDVTDRLARFAASRDPRALWPTLSESALSNARRAIATVVKAVLAEDAPPSLDADTDADAYALKVAAHTTGTGALLGRWVDDGRVKAADPVRSLLARELEQGRKRAARVERELLPALDALLASGVTPIVIKGFHTGRVYFDEPGLRPGADVDLIVPPKQIPIAEAALAAAGFAPSPRRSLDPFEVHWRRMDIDGRVFSVDGIDARNKWEIDLHNSFARLIAGQNVRLDDDLRQVVPFQVAGRALLAPKQPLLLAYSACHIASDLRSMRLLRLFEFVQVARIDHAKRLLDWDQVSALLRHAGAARFAVPAFELAERLSPGVVPQRVLTISRLAASRSINVTVAELSVEGGPVGRTSIMHYLMWVRNPMDLLRLGRVLLTEQEAFSPRKWLKRVGALLRMTASGSVALGDGEKPASEQHR